MYYLRLECLHWLQCYKKVFSKIRECKYLNSHAQHYSAHNRVKINSLIAIGSAVNA